MSLPIFGRRTRGAFSPLDLSETVLWLDPENGMDVSGDGSSIGSWADRRGFVTATQGTAANKPTLKLNIQNGMPIVRCDGGDYLQGAFSSALSQPFLAFVVAKLDAGVVGDSNTYYTTFGDDAVNVFSFFQRGSSNKWAWYTGTTLEGASSSDSNWNIFSGLSNETSSEFWINGSSDATGNAGDDNPDGITVGASNLGANGWDGDIGDIIICDPNLSTAKHNQIGQWLSDRWNISWTNLT